MAIISRTCPFFAALRCTAAIFIFVFFSVFTQVTHAQTVIFSNPGVPFNSTYLNTDQVETTNYGPVDISNCSSISFTMNFNFAFGWAGAGNMESNDECPFAPGPCDPDPDPANAETGSCANCWDFLYVQYQIDGVTVYSRLIGVPGDLAQSGTISFGPICTQGGTNASIIVQAQTWAANEDISTSNIAITCWDASSNPTATPDPACAGQPITLNANLVNPSSVGSVLWTGPGTINPNNQPNTTATGAPVGTNTYTLSVTDDNNCTKTEQVTVEVEPGPSMDNPGNQLVCSAQDVMIMFTGAATDFAWTNSNTAIGLGASGTGDIDFTAATVASNTTATITVTPSSGSCVGPPITFTITVGPGPTVNNVNDVEVCSGAFVSIPFSGTGGATFQWTNDNPAIGLAGSGTGNINFNSAAVTTQEIGNITVTPVTAAGCEGPPRTFTITVNPLAEVESPGNLVFCSGDDIFVEFMGTGINYNWTSTNAATGIPSSGMGNIDVTSPTFFNNQEVTTISVTATGGCPGPPTIFTITVRPTSEVSPVSNVSICSGQQVAVNFTSEPSSVTPTWFNDNPAIGLGLSGTGNLLFNGANVTVPTTGLITVQSILAACSGPAITFNITVSPGPSMNPINNISICGGGTIAAAFSGAGNGAIYNWTNSNPAIGLPASGTGNINVTAANPATTQTATITVIPTVGGCTGPARTFTVTVNAAPTMNIPANLTLCAGQNATVNFSGTSGANYNWINNNPNLGLAASGSGNISFVIPANITSNQVATITVTPQLGTCPGTPVNFDIIANALPTLTVANVQCAPNLLTYSVIVTSNATAVTASAGTVNPSTGGFTISQIPAGTNVTITASLLGCDNQTTVNSPNCSCPPVDAAGNPNNPSVCEGATIPALSVTVTAGLEAHWYTTTSGGTPILANSLSFTPAGPLSAGTYTFYVETRDPATGCVSATRTPVVLNVNATPTMTTPANVAVCAGGSVAVNFSGSNGAVFNWTNNNVNIGIGASGAGNIAFNSPTGLTANENATITVVPQIGTCPGVGVTFNIAVNALPVLTVGTTQCAPDLQTYTVTVSATNTATITATAGTVSGSGNAYTISAIPAGTNITLNASSAENCPAQQTVTAPNCNCPPVAIPSAPNNPSICSGATVPALTVTAAAGLQVDWFANAAGGTPLLTNSFSFTPTGPFTPGTYTFFAEAKDPVTGCVSANRTPVVLTVNETPTMLTPANVSNCAGIPVTVNFSGSTGATFAWTNTNTGLGTSAGGNGNISFTPPVDLATTQTGTFTVTPTLGTCNGTPVSFTITANAIPVITIGTVQCAPDLATYSVALTVPANTTISGTAGVVTGSNGNFVVTGIPAGTNINITATAPGNCQSQQAVTAPNCNCPPVAAPTNPSNPVICEGATIPAISVSVAPGLQVDWYLQPVGGVPIVTNTNSVVPPGGALPAGTYTFYAETRDPATGCLSPTRTPVTLTINPTPVANAPTSLDVCADQPVNIVFSGTPSTVYNWTNSNTNIGLGASGTGNISFTVLPDLEMFEFANVQVTPVLGTCTGIPVNFTITAKPAPTLDLTLVQCAASLTQYTIELLSDAASVTASAGTVVNNGNGTYSIVDIPEGTNVVLTATSANLCTNVQNVSSPNCNCPPVALPTNPNNPTICAGAPPVLLTVSAATGLEVNWFSAAVGGTALLTNSTSFAPSVNTNTPGTYTFYAETYNPQTNCSSTSRVPVVLTIVALPVASINGNNTVCAGTPVTLTAAGGSTYNWNTSSTASSITVSPITNTTYTVVVNDVNLCTATAQFTVQVNLPFNVTINTVSCDPAAVGTQVLNLQTINGCDSTVNIITTLDLSNCAPVINLVGAPTTCAGDLDGSFTLVITDGFGPFTYSWTGGGQSGNGPITNIGGSATVEDLSAGIYSVTVTGNNGATSVETVTVSAPPAVVPTVSAQVRPNGFGLSCAGATDGQINSAAAGGAGGYTYLWSNGSVAANISALGAGSYTVTVTDSNGCSAVGTATITAPAELALQLSTIPPGCGDTEISYTVASIGGSGPFMYELDGEPVSGPRIDITGGSHSIALVDNQGCIADTIITVSIPPITEIILTPEVVVDFGSPVTLNAIPNINVWDQIVWSPLRDTANAATLQQTWVPSATEVISVTITDTSGCKATATTRVFVNRNIKIYVPNVFDPGADDTNGLWQIYGNASVRLLQKVHIFDRWGSAVYLWDKPVALDAWPGWDGIVKGKLVDPGVFVYYIKIELADGEVVLLSGDVTVVR